MYLQQRGEVWRHITMVAKFLDQNNREFLHLFGEQEKYSNFSLAKKNNFARASRFFVHFLAVVAGLRYETS